MGSSLFSFDPCYGSLCRHSVNHWQEIFGSVAPAVPVDPNTTDFSLCNRNYKYSDQAAIDDCGADKVDENGTKSPCMYGPSYSHLGLECRLCSHPMVTNVQRTRCIACQRGQGPNAAHTECVRCNEHTVSQLGVCTACPIGSTNNSDGIQTCETMTVYPRGLKRLSFTSSTRT